jgi:hypothetical protein
MAGAFLAVTTAMVALSAVPAADKWATNPTKIYVANLRRSLAEADRGGRWSLYNTITPSWLMSVHYVPYSSMEYLGQLVTGRPVPINDPTARLLEVNAEGTALPAAFHTVATVPDHCTTRPDETALLPLQRPVDGSTFRFLVLPYTSVEPSWLRLAMNPGTGFVNADARGKRFPVRGSGTLLVQLHRLPIKQLRAPARHSPAPASRTCGSGCPRRPAADYLTSPRRTTSMPRRTRSCRFDPDGTSRTRSDGRSRKNLIAASTARNANGCPPAPMVSSCSAE